MPKATGVFKKIRYKKEVTWGTASGPSGGTELRRVTGDFNPTADNFASNEINTNFQVKDVRLGIRGVEGSLNGELSPATYSNFMESLLARDFTSETGTASASITIAASGAYYTIERSAGSFLTDGIKVGQVVRMTGAGLNAANVGNNCLVMSMTATILTVKVLSSTALVAEGPIATVAVVQVGKTTYIPQTGHTDQSYTIEQWFSDIAQSEVSTGVKVGSCNIQIPTTGLVTTDLSFMGKGVTTTGTSAYFTSPTAANSNGLLTSVFGSLLLNGAEVACVTDANISIERVMEAADCVGNNYSSGIFAGKINVTGSLSAYFEDATLRTAFTSESDVSLVLVITTGTGKAADFITLTLPRLRYTSYSGSDNELGITVAIDFQAVENTVTSAGLINSTIMIQDSAA